MKLLICPKSKDIEREINLGITSFLLGITGFTTNQNCCFDLDEIKQIQDRYPNIEIFLLLNKNIFNHELEMIEEMLKKIDTMTIAGIFFYDQAILSIHQRLNLNTPLVWNQTHMVTNYNTCSYYYNQGVMYGVLAGEITLDEMLEIRQKTKMKLIVTILGYPVMSHSNRKLLKNYFAFTKEEKKQDMYTLKEPHKEELYLVKEDESGTSFYEGLLLNGTEALCSLIEADFSYALIFENEIADDKLEKIIPLYKDMLDKTSFTDKEKTSYIEISKKILESDYTGFFFKKTIYKVKRND